MNPVFKKSKLVSVMVVLLLIFAFLQFNDPDAGVWTITYLCAAWLCFLAYLHKLPVWLALVSSALFVAGAVYQWPQVYKGITGTMDSNPEIEQARESLGLIISAVFVWISYYLQRRK